ncbi:MAG: hypothetical protein DRP99_04515 [Candidatus Latescibacterota bacterium]|nr:MAG: hypothetical protein DRP99_04515 [Candidatus Latescibacterota bacterium]
MFSELGVPVRSVNKVRLFPGRDRRGAPCIYAVMGQQAEDLFVLQIDPETGSLRQFVSDVPGSNYPTAALMSRTGKLYIGAAYAGHLLCFDPDEEVLEDLGPINPGAAVFPCRIDEGPDGTIWIGSYGTADLTSYDPETRRFTRYGPMDDVDMYNYPFVDADGKVVCFIRTTKLHVVAFDPRTGERRTVGPVVEKGRGNLELYRGKDGQLYIRSDLGNFRVRGLRAEPVDVLPDPEPEPTLPDGTRFSFSDAWDLTYRKLKLTRPDGRTQVFYLDYEASGSDIFCIHLGPDGCIYGSSVLPLHLFRYDPRDGSLTDLGRCSISAGEAYSMANFDGKMYIFSYPGARVSKYDPSRPYRFGENPRDLGRIDDISYRPRSALPGPLGRIWVASLPDYGMWGGPLSWYEPRTGRKGAYYRICGDASCYTLAHLEDQGLIAVGTNISGGSGTRPKVDRAVLFLWDYGREEKVWEGTLDRSVHAFNSLIVGPDGRLYGTVKGGGPPELFAFDPRSRKFTSQVPLPGEPLDLGLQVGPDGKIYGFTSSCIYRLEPSTPSLEVVVTAEGAFTVPGPILGKYIYFATGHRLRAVEVF